MTTTSPPVTRSFAGRRVLVIGDAMLDRYLSGAVRRISPEAPVPVVSLEREWSCPGGAGNVAASVASLGADVTFAAVTGTDEASEALVQSLRATGVKDLVLIQSPDLKTVTKTRVLGADLHQLLRLDVDGIRADYEKQTETLLAKVLPAIRHQAAVCLSDYDKGTLSPKLLAAVIEECRRVGVPCLVDPKKADFSLYANATVLTPNVMEAERALGRPLATQKAVEQAAAELRARLRLDAMLVTRGPDGMALATADGVQHFPAEVRTVADVAGAGDTVVATVALCLAAGWELAEACKLATLAAGIAVSKPGVYVVKAAEIDRVWNNTSPKILDQQAAREVIRAAQARGRKVVFTNGCFDILHAGHLHCLEQARRLGDMLVIGLNSDASVQMNKGTSRPIIPEGNRAMMLAGLACVDLVVLFDELTPEELVRALEPDVLVKGGDYDPMTMAGAEFTRSRGGQVLTIPLVPGLSTTRVLQGLRGAE